MNTKSLAVVQSMLREAIQMNDIDLIVRLKNVVDLLRVDLIKELEKELATLKLTARYKK